MNISDLPNFGPKSQQMLAQAGIHTIEQLRELGAVRAYLQVKRTCANSSLNLLWAMEGALTEQHWQKVAKHERLRLLLELEDAETNSTMANQPPPVEMKVGKSFENPAVARTFSSYPQNIRNKLLALRALIFEVAAQTEGIGLLEETLKWGEPAYLTRNKRGSTIRLGWKKSNPPQYALYFHCQTNLIETFRSLFANEFRFEGNRAILFDEFDELPTDSLAFCITAALTYHSRKSANRKACQ